MKIIIFLLTITFSSLASPAPVITKKLNSDGTVTYAPVGDPKAQFDETVSQHESKEIDKEAKELGVKVIDIKDQPVMTKTNNSDGTITYDPVDSKAVFTESIPKEKGKEVDKKLKGLGVKVIDVTDKGDSSKKK